ncbi:MAG: RNA-directed DNA polymerase [Bacteroidales bacterium]|nr:RNA-directed DNA polymerase [Bacteroidales bacterium]
MTLTYAQLMVDLRTAYFDARRHKVSKPYLLKFEENLAENLRALASELYSRTYRPRPSTCFIISDPKKREVFAAEFRDRIVHHLYYNYTHELFERGFIADSYSCIKHRGTHYGIARLEQHIRQESLNYTEKVYILKMDISGYFMNISRQRLFEIVERRLGKMRYHRINSRRPDTWDDRLDFSFLSFLNRAIILPDPTENCIIKGCKSDWDYLPPRRSLFHSPEGCGLPIGNLTSQLFSNVYLGEFDDFMKRTVRARRYGRYVDDFYVVDNDFERLQLMIPDIQNYLKFELGLDVNEEKTTITDSNTGVEFLGAYLRPHRRYISRHSLRRLLRRLPPVLAAADPAQINSYLGILSHYNAYRITKRLFIPLHYKRGYFTMGMKKYVPLPGWVRNENFF